MPSLAAVIKESKDTKDLSDSLLYRYSFLLHFITSAVDFSHLPQLEW